MRAPRGLPPGMDADTARGFRCSVEVVGVDANLMALDSDMGPLTAILSQFESNPSFVANIAGVSYRVKRVKRKVEWYEDTLLPCYLKLTKRVNCRSMTIFVDNARSLSKGNILTINGTERVFVLAKPKTARRVKVLRACGPSLAANHSKGATVRVDGNARSVDEMRDMLAFNFGAPGGDYERGES